MEPLTVKLSTPAKRRGNCIKPVNNWVVAPELVLAAGDGANDMLMVEAAIEGGGIGAAYRAKAALAEAKANFAIRHNDLTALLFAQGVRRTEWVMG
jgi:phosphoserine phosphatase